MTFPSRYFRAGVGAVIANKNGLVLALERSELPGAWQFPQGGWETNETPEESLFREVEEETGLTRARLELADRYPEPLAYELPPEWRSTKTGMGQVQHWFLLRLRDNDMDVVLPEDGEFRAWTWMPMGQIIRKTAPFRRPLYERLGDRFLNRIRTP
jgi:putative (di)nucleoside polyphosphate hydrolase